MRRIGSKRKSKKEKVRNTKQNGVDREESEASTNGAQESDAEAEENPEEAEDSAEEPEPVEAKRSKKKHSKRVSFSSKKSDESKENDEEEMQYEVESILDQKNIKGARYFLIRWKGYGEESDTWEPEGTLNCSDLLRNFKQQRKEDAEKLKKAKKKEKAANNKKKQEENADWDSGEEFEVDRIIEVHHKRDGSREFLVSWKGYPSSANSWEPEENMDCPHLIERFMDKVRRAKEVDLHELREVRAHPQRFSSNLHGRRSSKRQPKKRVSYQEHDE